MAIKSCSQFLQLLGGFTEDISLICSFVTVFGFSDINVAYKVVMSFIIHCKQLIDGKTLNLEIVLDILFPYVYLFRP